MHDMKENKNKNFCERNFEKKIFQRIVLGDCPTIHVGGAHELFWRVIKQILLGELSNKFYRNLVVSFREQKSFVLKTVFLLAFGLGMCAGVGEDSRHGIGHVDIQVGSCIYLTGIVFHDMCT